MQAHGAGQATAGWAGFSAVGLTKLSLPGMPSLMGRTQWGKMCSLPSGVRVMSTLKICKNEQWDYDCHKKKKKYCPLGSRCAGISLGDESPHKCVNPPL